ncbi:hypothetical protein ACW0PQ_004140 [Escherichia coli]
MMSELRAGGIAIVIFSENKLEIGRCVELIEKVTNGYVFNFPGAGKYSWRDDTPGWLVKGDVSIYTNEPSGGFSYFYSDELMPIDGEDFSHEDEQQKELANG